MGNPVVHFEIITKNAAALTEFYSKAFGWNVQPPSGGANIPDYRIIEPRGGSGIDGGIGTAPEGYDGHVTFYVGVADVAEALRKVQSLGADVMMEPSPIPGGTIALFKDPDGNVIGLVHGETQ